MMEQKFEVLIVDDIKDNLLALRSLLAGANVQIHQALSGVEALELMVKHDFCVALLDVQMPGMNGFELAELMRGTKKTKHIPIIFVTAASNDEKFVFKGYESGAVDFLRKPLDSHAVRSKVNIFLALHGQKKELEWQVIELNKTKAELEVAVNMREEFMSIAGHELKTPLTTLRLQTEIRLRKLKKGSPAIFTEAELQKMFDSDFKQLERLTRLIDDMLDISRISSGKLSIHLERFDLNVMVKDFLDRNTELFKQVGSELIVEADGTAFGMWDKFRIEQVITNLLTNATRYGSGKPIKVSVTNENGMGIVTIQDHGIGIQEADLKRIFQRFERATATAVTGLGLGLYIVSQIIEAHSGSIEVSSVQGEGSTFKVSLPLSN
jgi:signal transduction histidine kinase